VADAREHGDVPTSTIVTATLSNGIRAQVPAYYTTPKRRSFPPLAADDAQKEDS
jgi:hypothetical protein